MQTPEGKSMRVVSIKAIGYQSFKAIGIIAGQPHMITGHVATLNISCEYETVREGDDMPEFTMPDTVH